MPFAGLVESRHKYGVAQLSRDGYLDPLCLFLRVVVAPLQVHDVHDLLRGTSDSLAWKRRISDFQSGNICRLTRLDCLWQLVL